jgi:acetyl-CoA carboxylase biotin carboxyl carrier protein
VGTTPPAPAPGGATTPAAEAASSSLVTIEAPMVGTFYRSSSPGSDPYVREGDTVKQGQILCIIEAMKLMNEIESKVSGRIAKILVDNAQAVEFGQPLFLLDPLR